jgi:nucleotide-binding universal stress UspA family protein
MKILLAVDGSKASLDAVDSLIQHLDWYRHKPDVELITVHLPVPPLGGVGGGVSKAQLEKYYEEEGQAKLAEAKKKLDAAGIRYQAKVLVGQVAETIVKHARAAKCDLIYLGTRGMGGVKGMLMGSTATKVLHLADLPVLLVK